MMISFLFVSRGEDAQRMTQTSKGPKTGDRRWFLLESQLTEVVVLDAQERTGIRMLANASIESGIAVQVTTGFDETVDCKLLTIPYASKRQLKLSGRQSSRTSSSSTGSRNRRPICRRASWRTSERTGRQPRISSSQRTRRTQSKKPQRRSRCRWRFCASFASST